MGSTTVFGTLMTQVLLGANWLGFGLAILWALSPLGSKSSQPAFSTIRQNISSDTVVTYFDTSQASKFSLDLPEAFQTPLNAVYSALLMSPESVKNSTMDTWGNIKIPDHKRLATSFPPASSGWIPVPQNGVPYSSLLGIPTVNISAVGNTTFTVETTYLDLDCYNISQSRPVQLGNIVNETFWFAGQGNTFSIALDGFVLEDTQ